MDGKRQWKLFDAYWTSVEASRHIALRLAGHGARQRIAKLVFDEFERVVAENPNASAAAIRATVRQRVKAQVRGNEVGFVWWLPLALWAAEILIELLIKLWVDRRKDVACQTGI